MGAPLVVTIDDAGPGTDDAGPGLDDTEAVLAPFVRGSGAGPGGSGLGLAIVTEQLHRHGVALDLGPTPRFPTGTRAQIHLLLVSQEV